MARHGFVLEGVDKPLGLRNLVEKPRNAYSLPSASRWTMRHRPPGLASIFSTVVLKLFGPHHCDTSSGSVHASHTIWRGASKTPVAMIVDFPGSAVIFVSTISVSPPLFFGFQIPPC
jgi:hypothetical protein